MVDPPGGYVQSPRLGSAFLVLKFQWRVKSKRYVSVLYTCGSKRSNNMTPHIPEEFSTMLIDCSPFVIVGNTMPPRDPEENEDEEEEEGRRGRRTRRRTAGRARAGLRLAGLPE